MAKPKSNYSDIDDTASTSVEKQIENSPKVTSQPIQKKTKTQMKSVKLQKVEMKTVIMLPVKLIKQG